MCTTGKNLFTGLLAVLLLTGCARTEPSQVPEIREATSELFAMDTYLTMTAYGEQAEEALAQVEARILELEGRLSVTDGGSEIFAANHAGGPVSVSPDTEDLVRFALDMARQTGGALEPTLYPVLTAWGFTTGQYQIPAQEELDRLLELVDYEKISLSEGVLTVPEGMMLDLGAVGKGFAADEAGAILRAHGVTSALLDLGGNILAVGTRPDGAPWRVGLRDPDTDGTLGVLEVADQSVVVSGGYERYFVGEDGERCWHILDPETGRPAQSGLVQVAVVSRESRLCDGLSTALFVMGLEEAVDYWRLHRDFEMALLTQEREIYMTEGLEHVFSLGAGQEGRAIHTISGIA